MKVESILNSKGRDVQTIGSAASVQLAVHQLSTMGIGALVVSDDGRRVDGLVTEREIVRGLARHGPSVLDLRVHDVMAHRRTPSATSWPR